MPLPNGLYKIEFRTQKDQGFGVLMLQDEKLWGGDSSMYYVGTYAQDGDNFSAEVKTGRHSNTPGIESVFGLDSVNITLKGTSSGTGAEMTGVAAEAPDVSFQAVLSKLSD